MKEINLHLASFPCLAGLTLAFAPHVVAKYLDRFVAAVGVLHHQDNRMFLRRLEAYMPRRPSTHHLAALPRCIPHSTFLNLPSLAEMQEWLRRQYMAHHLHLQNSFTLPGVAANKVLHPLRLHLDIMKMPFLAQFLPDWWVPKK